MVGQGNDQHGVSGAQVLADPAGAAVELLAAGGEAVNHEGGDTAFKLLRLVEGVLEVGDMVGRGGGINIGQSLGTAKGAGEKSALVIVSILVTSAGFLLRLIPVSRP